MGELNFYDDKVSEPQLREYIVKLVGNGAGQPTKPFGNGVSVSRTGVGVFRVTFTDNPANVIGLVGFQFTSATMTDVKGYTATGSRYASATQSIDVSVWNSLFAAVDLTTAQDLTLRLATKRTSA